MVAKEEPACTATGAPRRKVLAAGAGGGLGGNLAVILAYHFPELPEIVVAAYTSIFVTVLAVAAAYLVPERDKGADRG